MEQAVRTEPTQITDVISIGDEDGIYVFDNGDMYAWTSGRGGFVVEGGLGYWPKFKNDEANRANMMRADGISRETEFIPDHQGTTTLNDWNELKGEIREKLRQAFQSDSKETKYSLGNRLEPEEIVVTLNKTIQKGMEFTQEFTVDERKYIVESEPRSHCDVYDADDGEEIDPTSTVANAILLGLFGEGPCSDGETRTWTWEKLEEDLKAYHMRQD